MMRTWEEGADDGFLEYIFPGQTSAMRTLRSEIAQLNHQHRIYRNVPTILLVGDTGVGKTFAAQAIAAHGAWLRLSDEERSFYRSAADWSFQASPAKLLRALTGAKFDEVYLPLLTDDIASSELFGHVKGAFTGAVRDNPGRLGNAELTDLLLDEVGDSTHRVQTKLLQVVESRMYTPVGGTRHQTRETEARLILATHRNLHAAVRAGTFREDLFWRLQGLILRIPPLRECPDAVPDLVRALSLSCQKEQGKQGVAIFPSKQDLLWCQRHEWPGNLRELRLLVWHFTYENGRRSLKDIHLSRQGLFAGEVATGSSGEEPEILVSQAVQAALDATLGGRRPSLGTVGAFTRHFDRIVRGAIYGFKGDRRLRAAQLERLFTKEKARDVHTKIGRFRLQGESRRGTRS